jgi:hypothetical protein
MATQNPRLTGLNRRDFFAVTAASLAAASVPKPETRGAPWYAALRRCGQINFNERDPLTMDAEAWMDYWASLKVNAVLLNGGGIVAFYPTEVPFHHRSQFLGSRDLFGDMVSAAKKRSLRVIARMDCNLAWEEALRAHPEWFERNSDGSARADGESTWLYRTCMFSAYFSAQMPAIYREINRRYPVDGFFTNGWPGTDLPRVCHCENCRRIYREKIGGTPPDSPDLTNPLYRKFSEVHMDRVKEIWRLWDLIAKERQRDSLYIGNLGGGIRAAKSLKQLSEVASWFNADHQGRSGNTPIWDCAQQGRVAQSVMKGRTITCVTGAYSNSSVVWRHVAKPPAEATLWLAQTAASGMVPWFHWLGGSPEDKRWRDVGRSFYQWLASNEGHFCNRRSLAHLAVLYPQSAIAFYKPSQPAKGRLRGPFDSADYLNGLYYALLEGRFLFDFVHQEDLSAETLAKYRALLIPNAAYFRDSECAAVREYAARGGSVLATFETSRYNERGERREDFGLAGVFGASALGETLGPQDNTYMRIEQRHAVTSGFEGTELLPGAESRVAVKAVPFAPLVLSVVPHYPWYPPEMVYPRATKTNEPAVILRQDGASRIAYFPGDIDRTFWVSGNTDLSLLLQNTVRWVLGDSWQPARVRGEGIIEIFAWETDPGYALHLLNYTNPNMTRGFIRRFYPIGPQQVEFDIAPGKTTSEVRALRASRSLPFTQSDRTVSFEVPSVTDYEVIALT